MKAVKCESCGANEWKDEKGYRICVYCGSKYQLSPADYPVKESVIELDEDIKRLLQKCQDEPQNAVKYAKLILDLDPNNVVAKRYLNR